MDRINGTGDLIFYSFAPGVGTWAFIDVKGLFYVIYLMGKWAPWSPAKMPEMSPGGQLFLRSAGAMVAAGAGLTLLGHFL